eukprot:TRINITY_DN3613_c0_g1_i3.p1 TRINITY_DN3613_c0_g1~~TRINITY_DN3613_c0_g1_i3.p1  ORF type:complete len:508 (+),score=146.69 TRINITY_DN3613_c0_g1_i3:1323-2846(+)
MNKPLPDMKMCNKSHKLQIEAYCTQCCKWTCGQCKAEHTGHKGHVKDLVEMTNQSIIIYQEYLKQIKRFISETEGLPTSSSYENAKSAVINKIVKGYEELVVYIYKHRDMHIKKIYEYIDRAKKKKLKIETEAKNLKASLEELEKVLAELKEAHTGTVPKETVLDHNNVTLIKSYQDHTEQLKNLVERCTKIQEKFLRFSIVEIAQQFKDSYVSKLIHVPTDFKGEPRLVFLQPKTKNVVVTNLDTMKKRQVAVEDKKFKFPAHFEFIELKYRLILCGGIDEKGGFLADTYCISIETKGVKKLGKMEVEKGYHSLAALSNSSIYSVGGLGQSGPLKVCESLSLITNEWRIQSPLNEARQGAGTCLFGGKYLYCVGGKGKGSEIHTTIEVLDIKYRKLGWSVIQLPEDVWQPVYFIVCTPVDLKHIVIAGGINAKGNSVANAYKLNVEYNVLTKIKPMKAPDCFFERDKRLFKGKVYAVAYESYAIHIYDIRKDKWNIIKSADEENNI